MDHSPKKPIKEPVPIDMVLAFLVFIICLLFAFYLPTTDVLLVPPPVVQV